MASWSRPVPPALPGCVLSWIGYDYRTAPDAVHHGLPSLGMTLVLSLDDPVDCGWLCAPQRVRSEAFVAGLHTAPALIRTHGRQHGLHLSFDPLALRALFGLPARDLVGEIVDADALGWPPALLDEMRPALWPRRFDLVERFLLQRLSDTRTPARPEVHHVWSLICRTHGSRTVESMAPEIGLSRRRLSTVFREETGLTPKQASRVARFEHARVLISTGRSLAEVAAHTGYSDQSHLTREWRSLAGVTPQASRVEFSNLQDAGLPGP